MAVIVILEGPDGAGKTSVANALSDAFGECVVIHNGPETRTWEEFGRQLEDADFRRDRGVSTIIDRSYLSEVIYGNAYRGESLITRDTSRMLEEVGLDLGVLFIAVQAPESVRRERIEARGEVWDQTQYRITRAYNKAFSDPNGPWITVGSPA